MKPKILTLLFITLNSCSFIDSEHYSVDPKLKPFVDQFYNEAMNRKIRLQKDRLYVSVGDISGSYQAITVRDEIVKVMVAPWVVNRFHKNDSATFYQLQYVIYHELGHALLHRGHTYGVKSIMDVDGKIQDEYSNNKALRKELINELFKR